MDCERPLLQAVSRCGRQFEQEVWPCKNHRSSLCRPCATRYGRRVESLAAHGLNGQDGFIYALTMTAPSHREHCMKAGCDADDCPHEKCRCTPAEGLDLGEWNPCAAKMWNRFLLDFERHYGERPAYFRAVEVQDGKRTADGVGRQALHFHVLLRTQVSLSTKTLRKLAVDNGFGHELKLDTLPPGSRAAARYVAKYVTKSCNERDDVPWIIDLVDPETFEVTHEQAPATFRAWSQSKNWGTTMAAICVDVRRRWELAEQDRQTAAHLAAGQPPRDVEPAPPD